MDLNLRLYGKEDMSHSSGTSFNSGRQEQNQLPSPKNHLSVGEVGNASNVSGPLIGFRNVESTSAGLTMGARNYINSQPSSQGYFMSYLSQPGGRGFVTNYDRQTTDVQLLNSRLAQNFKNSNNASFIGRGNFSSARPMWLETSSIKIPQIQPQGSTLRECINEGGQSSVPFAICRQEKADHLQSMQAFRINSDTDLRMLKQGCGDYQSTSTLFLGQENRDICSTFKRSAIPLSRKDDGSFLMLNNVSPSNHPQACHQDLHQGIQNLSQTGLFPSWSSSLKLKMLDQQNCLQRGLRSAPDVGTMRTFTPVNSGIRASEGPRMISETTHSLANGERLNASFCNGNQLIDKFEILDLNKDSCQAFGHSQQGVKLQRLDSSSGSGGIEIIQHPSSGAEPFILNKNIKSRSKPVIPVIPDLNIALPEFPGAGNLMGQVDASTQGSKSSDRVSLHAREPANKTRKKRKICDILDSGDSARKEINNSFRQVLKGKRSRSELTFAGKDVIVLDSDDSADDGPSHNNDQRVLFNRTDRG